MNTFNTWPPKVATWRTTTSIWTIASLLIFFTGIFVFRFIEDTHTREYIAAQRDLSNLTRVAQEHAIRTLRSADQVISFMNTRYLEIANELDLVKLTKDGVIDEEIFTQVGIIDAKGVFVKGSRPFTQRLDLSDREHFKVHIARDTERLFVSKPVLGRTSQRWSIQLTRRITLKNGDFGGVVVVSIDPGYFTHFYKELNLGSEGVTALYGLDGISRARTGSGREGFGTNEINAPQFSLIAKGQESGTYIYRSVLDGVNRMYYFRRIPGYDLVVTAGVNIEDLKADIWRQSNAILLQAGLLCLLVVALAFALTQYLGKLRRAVHAQIFSQNQVLDRTEQLNTIFALSPDGFVSFDQERRVKYVNPALVSMTALKGIRLEGMDEIDISAWLSERCALTTPFCGIAKMRESLNGGGVNAPQLLELTGLSKCILQVTLRLSDTQTVSQILYFRDVTHETEVDEMKSDFLTTAAHELRTPMASILGFSELLLDNADPETQQEFISIIHTQSKAMAVILDELLDLARIEARRDKDFEYTQLEIKNMCANIFKSLPLQPGRILPTVSMPIEPLYLLADEGKLRQAIVNVLMNAYKYSPDGGPIFFTMDRLQEEGQPGQVRIEIKDHGIGMTAEQASRIYERFYRADKSGKIPGSGLGMSLVQEIIKLHSGKIEVMTILNKGTSVYITLPLIQN